LEKNGLWKKWKARNFRQNKIIFDMTHERQIQPKLGSREYLFTLHEGQRHSAGGVHNHNIS
jgi:hypothetical protein